jgi:hypothetical protein
MQRVTITAAAVFLAWSAAQVGAEPPPVLSKLDSELRWTLRGATHADMRAIAELSSPVTPEQAEMLADQGLRILRSTCTRLHVEGDTGALLRLASLPQVVRLRASAAFRPLQAR